MICAEQTRVPSRLWAKDVKQMYGYTCVCCNKHDRGKKMHAHHIIPRHEAPELSNVLENGVAVCSLCHRQIHTAGSGDICKSEKAVRLQNKIIEIARNSEIIIFRVKKGDRDIIKKFAESCGESANEFIKRAIHDTMQREGASELISTRSENEDE